MRSLVSIAVLPGILLLVIGCSETVASGTLVDGLTDAPIPEMRLIATAQGSTTAACSVLETYTDASGAFTFKGICSGVAYGLKPENENIWLADGDVIPDGGGTGLTFKGYRAPDGHGMYRLLNGELAAIKTNADIQVEPIWNNDTETVSYPAAIPTKPVTIPSDARLVLVGKETIEEMTYTPLIASEERKFGSSKTTIVKMKPWAYIGTEFTSDTEFTRKDAALDESKMLRKASGDRDAAWIRGDALPPGRYVVHKKGANRTTVLEFGSPAD